jgi:hypothetical protein
MQDSRFMTASESYKSQNKETRNYVSLFIFWISNNTFDLPKGKQMMRCRYCRILSDSTAVCYPTFTATSRPQYESSYTNLIGTTNINHSASNISNHAHSKAVYWTATNLKIAAYTRKVWLPEKKTLISWKSGCTLDAIHLTNMAKGHNRFPVLAELSSMVSGSLSLRHGASSGCGWRNSLRYWG